MLYKSGKSFEPVVKPYEYIAILEEPKKREDIPVEAYYQVVGIEPIPTVEKTFLVSPAGETGDQEVSEVQVGYSEIGQFRIGLDGVCKLYVKQPRGVSKYELKNIIAYIDPTLGQEPQTEFYVKGHTSIYVNLVNLSSDRYELAKIWLTGYRLLLEPLGRVPEKFTPIYIRALTLKER